MWSEETARAWEVGPESQPGLGLGLGLGGEEAEEAESNN